MSTGKATAEVLEARRQLAARIRTDWDAVAPKGTPGLASRFDNAQSDDDNDDEDLIMRPRFYASSDPSSNSSLSSISSRPQGKELEKSPPEHRKSSFTAPLVAVRSAVGSARSYFDTTVEPIDEERQARRRERQRRRRVGREDAETEWNNGLICWVERRDRWCCARKVATRQSREGTRTGHPAAVPLSINRVVSVDEKPLLGKTASRPTSSDASIPPHILIPIAPPLLPTSDPTYAHITPAHYPSIYSKVVLQSLTPSVPINLSHLIPAMVQGWKADGEWPPGSNGVDGNTGSLALSSIAGAGSAKKQKSSSSKRSSTLNCMAMPTFGAMASPITTSPVMPSYDPPSPVVSKPSKRSSLNCMPMPSFTSFHVSPSPAYSGHASAGGGGSSAGPTTAVDGPLRPPTPSAPQSPSSPQRPSSRSGLLSRRLLERRAQQSQTNLLPPSSAVTTPSQTATAKRSRSQSLNQAQAQVDASNELSRTHNARSSTVISNKSAGGHTATKLKRRSTASAFSCGPPMSAASPFPNTAGFQQQQEQLLTRRSTAQSASHSAAGRTNPITATTTDPAQAVQQERRPYSRAQSSKGLHLATQFEDQQQQQQEHQHLEREDREMFKKTSTVATTSVLVAPAPSNATVVPTSISQPAAPAPVVEMQNFNAGTALLEGQGHQETAAHAQSTASPSSSVGTVNTNGTRGTGTGTGTGTAGSISAGSQSSGREGKQANGHANGNGVAGAGAGAGAGSGAGVGGSVFGVRKGIRALRVSLSNGMLDGRREGSGSEQQQHQQLRHQNGIARTLTNGSSHSNKRGGESGGSNSSSRVSVVMAAVGGGGGGV